MPSFNDGHGDGNDCHRVVLDCVLFPFLLLLRALQRQRRAVEAVYEARPVPKDHQVPGDMQGSHWSVS